MAFDPDNVRVDLLKIKRKIYISHPEGSQERKDYLLASKISELGYLTKLVDPQVVEEVFAEYQDRLKSEVYTIFCCFLVGLGLSLMFLGFHQSHPHSTWLNLFYVPFCFGIGFSFTHITHLHQLIKDFKPFKNEYEVMLKKIEKLTEEIKGLAK